MKNKIWFFVYLISLLLFPAISRAEMLDKIVAIFNNKIITQSILKRIQSTLSARKNISPQIYSKDQYKENELLNLIIQKMLIREKLSELGFIINDDEVESQIKNTEKRLGLNRQALLEFLASNNITFPEYFEIMREAMEFNLFMSKIIDPMISISEQDIKNYFYKQNEKNQTFSFKYGLTDYSIKKTLLGKLSLSNLIPLITTFQKSGILPQELNGLETNSVENLIEEGLTDKLRNALKSTPEGSSTSPLEIDNVVHIFQVNKKDLVESDLFQQEKDKIRMKLYQDTTSEFSSLWFKREENKHYIKINIEN